MADFCTEQSGTTGRAVRLARRGLRPADHIARLALLRATCPLRKLRETRRARRDASGVPRDAQPGGRDAPPYSIICTVQKSALLCSHRCGHPAAPYFRNTARMADCCLQKVSISLRFMTINAVDSASASVAFGAMAQRSSRSIFTVRAVRGSMMWAP
jgi:hypothetical protein